MFESILLLADGWALSYQKLSDVLEFYIGDQWRRGRRDVRSLEEAFLAGGWALAADLNLPADVAFFESRFLIRHFPAISTIFTRYSLIF